MTTDPIPCEECGTRPAQVCVESGLNLCWTCAEMPEVVTSGNA